MLFQSAAHGNLRPQEVHTTHPTSKVNVQFPQRFRADEKTRNYKTPRVVSWFNCPTSANIYRQVFTNGLFFLQLSLMDSSLVEDKIYEPTSACTERINRHRDTLIEKLLNTIEEVSKVSSSAYWDQRCLTVHISTSRARDDPSQFHRRPIYRCNCTKKGVPVNHHGRLVYKSVTKIYRGVCLPKFRWWQRQSRF